MSNKIDIKINGSTVSIDQCDECVTVVDDVFNKRRYTVEFNKSDGKLILGSVCKDDVFKKALSKIKPEKISLYSNYRTAENISTLNSPKLDSIILGLRRKFYMLEDDVCYKCVDYKTDGIPAIVTSMNVDSETYSDDLKEFILNNFYKIDMFKYYNDYYMYVGDKREFAIAIRDENTGLIASYLILIRTNRFIDGIDVYMRCSNQQDMSIFSSVIESKLIDSGDTIKDFYIFDFSNEKTSGYTVDYIDSHKKADTFYGGQLSISKSVISSVTGNVVINADVFSNAIFVGIFENAKSVSIGSGSAYNVSTEDSNYYNMYLKAPSLSYNKENKTIFISVDYHSKDPYADFESIIKYLNDISKSEKDTVDVELEDGSMITGYIAGQSILLENITSNMQIDYVYTNIKYFDCIDLTAYDIVSNANIITRDGFYFDCSENEYLNVGIDFFYSPLSCSLKSSTEYDKDAERLSEELLNCSTDEDGRSYIDLDYTISGYEAIAIINSGIDIANLQNFKYIKGVSVEISQELYDIVSNSLDAKALSFTYDTPKLPITSWNENLEEINASDYVANVEALDFINSKNSDGIKCNTPDIFDGFKNLSLSKFNNRSFLNLPMSSEDKDKFSLLFDINEKINNIASSVCSIDMKKYELPTASNCLFMIENYNTFYLNYTMFTTYIVANDIEYTGDGELISEEVNEYNVVKSEYGYYFEDDSVVIRKVKFATDPEKTGGTLVSLRIDVSEDGSFSVSLDKSKVETGTLKITKREYEEDSGEKSTEIEVYENVENYCGKKDTVNEVDYSVAKNEDGSIEITWNNNSEIKTEWLQVNGSKFYIGGES